MPESINPTDLPKPRRFGKVLIVVTVTALAVAGARALKTKLEGEGSEEGTS